MGVLDDLSDLVGRYHHLIAAVRRGFSLDRAHVFHLDMVDDELVLALPLVDILAPLVTPRYFLTINVEIYRSAGILHFHVQDDLQKLLKAGNQQDSVF